MDKLTTEQKARAYDKAYKKVAVRFGSNVADEIFLKESEDERIRKEILSLIRYTKGRRIGYEPRIHQDKMIAWLEKQGSNEVKLTISDEGYNKAFQDGIEEVLTNPQKYFLEKQGEQKFEQKFFINDKVVHKATGKIWTIHYYLKDTNSYYVQDNDGLLHHYRESELKLVEQKPTEWSEEDEAIYYGVIETEQYMLDVVNGIKKFDVGNASIKEDCTRELDWLKSLRPQSQWRPSKEQITVLHDVAAYIDNSIYANQKDILVNLYLQLKKLND